jgi:hypothetical protein
MAPFIGRVLLLSPILGEFNNQKTRTGFLNSLSQVSLPLRQ